MTVVIVLQGLAAALVALLVLEAWLRRDDPSPGDVFGASYAEAEFHPELIVAWDDEATRARPRPCTRSASAAQRQSRRSRSAGTHVLDH